MRTRRSGDLGERHVNLPLVIDDHAKGLAEVWSEGVDRQ